MSKRERIEALEARVAVAEKRLAALEIEPPMCTAEHPINGRLCTRDKGHTGSHQALTRDGALLTTWSNVGPETWPASSAPDSIEQTTPECRACGGSGYADYAAVPCPACETVPPEVEPVPQWRAMVDSWAESGVMGAAEDSLAAVLWLLYRVAVLQGVDHGDVADALARIVAVAEGQVGDGWKADPGRVPHGYWGIAWLLAPLSHEPPNWAVVADRAAAWLRNLTDGAS